MENNRHITQPPAAASPWETIPVAAILVMICRVVTRGCKTLWSVALLWLAVVVIGLVVVAALSQYLLYGDIILTNEGIRRERRLKTRDVPWSGIVQTIAMEYSNTKVLVLVKTGGFKLTEKCSKGWFFFRNPGKTILLPDDQFTRRFVAEYHGPLDFDLSDSGGQ